MNTHPGAPEARSRTAPTATAPAAPTGAFALLRSDIQRAIAIESYTVPTPIQERGIPPLLEGRDLIGTAQTGTGKTAAFTLPLLQRLAESDRSPAPRALILAPTRELAAQIGDSLTTYGRFLRLRHTVIFGGVSQFRQVRDLQRGVDIIVATPGRLLDLMHQGHIRLDGIDVLILDEVDRMLDMGFIPDIKRVLAAVPAERQTVFLSATMPPKVETLAATMVRDAVRIAIAPESPAVERISQSVMFVAKNDKPALLADLLAEPSVKRAIVFTQMKFAANRVAQKLAAAGISSAAIHGNKSQPQRTRALDGFRRGTVRVLVATDVAARGIDVDGISHVINYDLPIEPETYVHRIGRTARAGADGMAISFCSAEERAMLAAIERLIGRGVTPDEAHAYHCDKASHLSPSAPAGRAGQRPRAGRTFRQARKGPKSGRKRRW